jgi:signal transduction histidine kinase/ActR/RegA family two-component response regulator
MSMRVMTVALRTEQDVVTARQLARQISGLLAFEPQDQVRIATAVSEIARNAFRYAGGGDVEFSVEGVRAPQLFSIHVSDHGPGIANLDAIIRGTYRSSTGMGLGIVGARRLMDHCNVTTAPGETRVMMQKLMPEAAPVVTLSDIDQLTKALASPATHTPQDEIQEQNRELIRTLGELREQQLELLSVNRELEDTNRGVVALYSELEERAALLRVADETKTRFLSNMTHEFRTPLNSMRALTDLLLARSDGPVTPEQEIQLGFISTATASLTDLVDDLLDLAKIEAGKVEVRISEVSLEELFSALRGMLRPLLVTDNVRLRFHVEASMPSVFTDESKVAQILRNLISNALKFTEQGDIRVTAARDLGDAITLSVTDNGIGVAEENHERIFEEFTQIPGALQSRVKGTGLGLPLCRRLAHLLGGAITLRSALGQGSTFKVTLPVRYQQPDAEMAAPPASAAGSAGDALPAKPPQKTLPAAAVLRQRPRARVLIIDDEPAARYTMRKLFDEERYEVIEAADAREGLLSATTMSPDMIVLDLNLPDRRGEDLLKDLRDREVTRKIPVIVATSQQLSSEAWTILRQRAAAVLPKSTLTRESFDEILKSVRRVEVTTRP